MSRVWPCNYVQVTHFANVCSTSTKISISTKTGKGITRTSTTSVTTTKTALSSSFTTINQSVYSTAHQTQNTTLVLDATSTALSTETTTTTSTLFETLLVTTTYSTALVTSTAVVTSTLPAIQRRETSISILPDRTYPSSTPELPSNGTLNARQNSNGQCRPATFTPDDVPDYASPCRDLRSYSTACQQLGVTGKTLTLSPSTEVVTRTSVTTSTPTLIIVSTKSFQATTTNVLVLPITQFYTSITNLTTTQTVTTTATSVVTSTVISLIRTNTTSTKPVTISVLATSTTYETSVALATPTPSACSSFRLTAPSLVIGSYFRSFGASEKLGFTPLPALAATFSLDSQNRLYETSTKLYLNTDPTGLYYVYLDPSTQVDAGGYAYLKCKIDGGKLACNREGESKGGFWWCPVIGPPDALIWGTDEDRVRAGGWDCVAIAAQVECV